MIINGLPEMEVEKANPTNPMNKITLISTPWLEFMFNCFSFSYLGYYSSLFLPQLFGEKKLVRERNLSKMIWGKYFLFQGKTEGEVHASKTVPSCKIRKIWCVWSEGIGKLELLQKDCAPRSSVFFLCFCLLEANGHWWRELGANQK